MTKNMTDSIEVYHSLDHHFNIIRVQKNTHNIIYIFLPIRIS